MRNVQLSLYSLFPAFFVGVIFLDGEFVGKYGFFAGYNWVVALSIVVQSFGGIVAAFCIFFADNISKNFAVSISMVLSSLVSFLFFGFTATTNVSARNDTCFQLRLIMIVLAWHIDRAPCYLALQH